MARYTGAVCKLCRRERQKLFLKGSKCFSDKCPVEDRKGEGSGRSKNYPPGQHGLNRRIKISEYGTQLREKQKVKRIYGVLEKQFRNLFEKASRQKGITGDNLIKSLERRFDNVVYRIGFAPSRKAARQLILHCHILVNGKQVNIPSYMMMPGDVIKVREKSKQLDSIHNSLKRVRDNQYPWLSLDKANLTGTFLQIPERADVPLNVREQFVVELYSK